MEDRVSRETLCVCSMLIETVQRNWAAKLYCRVISEACPNNFLHVEHSTLAGSCL